MGTLMDDILRVRRCPHFLRTLRLSDDIFQTLSQLPQSRASIKHVHLVESSPSLRAVQQKKLEPWDGKNGLKIHWHDSIDDVPTANGIYTMLVAHEFFDALPFHLIEVRAFNLFRPRILTLLENAPRLERGLAHLRPRSGCQNYPQALTFPFGLGLGLP